MGATKSHSPCGQLVFMSSVNFSGLCKFLTWLVVPDLFSLNFPAFFLFSTSLEAGSPVEEMLCGKRVKAEVQVTAAGNPHSIWALLQICWVAPCQSPALSVPQFPHLSMRDQTRPFWFWHSLISELEAGHGHYILVIPKGLNRGGIFLQDHASDAHCNLFWGDGTHRSIAWLDEGWDGGGGDAAKVLVIFQGLSVPLSGLMALMWNTTC